MEYHHKMKTPPQIKYIRHGKCNQCGACCRALSPGEWKNGMTGATCNKLVKGKCSIYKDKPEECKEFPNSPGDLIYKRVKDKCGYWFEEIRK